jgi:hypothetical protein
MAPQGFTAQANIDKMKQFIEKFCDSDTVKKEVGSVDNFKQWLATFNFEVISQPALDELI